MNAEFRDRLQTTNSALDSALSNVSRKLHALDIVYPQIARICKFEYQAPADSIVLADLIRERTKTLLIAADLLTFEAEKELEARKAQLARKESPDAPR